MTQSKRACYTNYSQICHVSELLTKPLSHLLSEFCQIRTTFSCLCIFGGIEHNIMTSVMFGRVELLLRWWQLAQFVSSKMGLNGMAMEKRCMNIIFGPQVQSFFYLYFEVSNQFWSICGPS